MLKKYEFILKDLDCANCAREIEEALSEKEGMKNVVVNFNTLKLSYETDSINEEQVKKWVNEVEPDVEVLEIDKKTSEEKSIKKQIIRLVIGIFVAGLGVYIEKILLQENSFINQMFNLNILANCFIILGYAILLYRTAKNAIKLLVKSYSINENLLITISCIGAYLIGEHLEGLMVIILYEIGKILEDKAVNKSRKSISDLMNIKPEYANLKTKDGTEKVSPEEVKIGDIVVIKQGEKIPLDGIIISGEASLNTASLTGESKLRKVSKSDKVLSGSINTDGLIEIKVTEEYKNSTVSRILELVENATDKKAKTETFVNKTAKIYTPIVIALAIIVAVILPIFSNTTYSESIYRALIFLVISCPCSIAISVPLSYFSGIGKASKNGILIKGSNFLDSLKDVKEIVFDKTGTITKGEFGVSKIEVLDNSYSEEEILKIVVAGENFSNHPIAKSIINSSKINEKLQVENYKEIAGKGISYTLNGKEILIGNSSLAKIEEDNIMDTVIYVSINDKLVAKIYLLDEIKDGAKEAIKALKNSGIKVKMFTGDNASVAKKIAKELEINEFKVEMLPEEKYQELEKDMKNYEGLNSKVAFVGDGINDSPVLARSDIGISMGGVGQASAIEASDVVIMTDDLSKISSAIEISKRTNKIIMQNLIFAIAVKILVLGLSTFGLAGMWQAIFADVGVTLITIFNTLRILK